jgi:hypothetical protein
MFNQQRTIDSNGILSKARQSYVPENINVTLPPNIKPDANHINIDRDKATSDARYAQQQQQQANAGGSVICTELKRLGIMIPELYEHAHLGRPVNKRVLNGYHLWAVPYVEMMRRWSLPRTIAAPMALAWAHHMAHKLKPEKYPNKSPLGAAVHVIGGTICWIIGLFIPVVVKWQSLYTGRNDGYPWPTR